MKKLVIAAPVLVLMIVISGCLKDKPNVDFSKITATAEITTASNNPTANAPSAGFAFFPAATVFLGGAPDPDTISFTVNIASDYPPTKDVAITIGVDQGALAKVNADTVVNSSRIQYAVFPDSTYTIVSTSGVVKAGSRLATFYVVFYPSKVDPTVSYALPISILTASGVTLSANLSTIYFHQIGNPIAGAYTQEWIRYNTATQTGSPAFDETSPTVFSPINATTINVASGTGTVYNVTFTNTGGVLSNFQVTFVPSSVTAAGITITSGPTIVLADPVNHKYEFNFTYLNGSGAPRDITDKFY